MRACVRACGDSLVHTCPPVLKIHATRHRFVPCNAIWYWSTIGYPPRRRRRGWLQVNHDAMYGAAATRKRKNRPHKIKSQQGAQPVLSFCLPSVASWRAMFRWNRNGLDSRATGRSRRAFLSPFRRRRGEGPRRLTVSADRRAAAIHTKKNMNSIFPTLRAHH